MSNLGGAMAIIPPEVGVIVIVIFIIVLIVTWATKSSNDKYRFGNADYQYYPPPITVQNKYYKDIQNECAGNTYNYNCLEKVHLKAFRGDMENQPTAAWDAQTHVCMNSPDVVDEFSLYRCLDGTYADYRYP